MSIDRIMRTSLSAIACASVLVSSVLAGQANAEEWVQFRGPNSAGISTATGIPTEWASDKNVVWSTKLPGPGGSSPIIVGDRVYVTSYSGYAESIDAPGDINNLKRHLICLERATGKILWEKEFKAVQPESEYVGGNNTRHGYSTSTPVSDGKSLFVFFGISGAFAFDLDGNELWKTDLGTGTHGWGSATSPVLYKDTVIINAGVESENLVALEKATGKAVWTTGGLKSTWASPVLVDVEGKTEVVVSLPEKLVAYDPETGKELWSCAGVPDFYVCPSIVAGDGVVYATGGRKSATMAVRAGGQGDVTATHVLWKVEEGNNVTSPVLLDGYLYWLHESRGSAFCVDAKTGAIVYQGELEPRPGLLYASITAVDGKLYAPSQDNGTYVLAAKPEFQQLAVNKFADDPSRVNASVAVSNNQLIMRTDQTIYCIGQ